MLKTHSEGTCIYASVFILFSVVIAVAILYFSPWWGVMDDASNLAIAADFWKHPGLAAFRDLLSLDVDVNGRLRPLYQLWIIGAYSLFRSFPAGLYLCVACAGLATLPVWGRIINMVFPDAQNKSFNFFVYPLSFFIFTPFWNNFMYISLLEKFVYFFATISVYYYVRSYQENRPGYMVIAFVFMTLGIFSKETAISLAGAFCAYSLLDLGVFHKNRKLSLAGFLGGIFIFIGYYLLIRNIWSGGYSVLYKNNFNLAGMRQTLISAALVIKMLFIIGLVSASAGVILFIRKKKRLVSQEFILFPIFLCIYLAILAPWGFVNYHLGPAAPFLMLSAYPVYMFIAGRNTWWRRILNLGLIVLIFLVLFFIIIPRISKMGDTKKVVSAVVSMRGDEGRQANFFMAPPFAETAGILQMYTKREMTYLKAGLLDKEMLKPGAVNYIIFEDRCSPVRLRNVVIDKEVYDNKTWKIFSLKSAVGRNTVFAPVFEINFLQNIKDRIKRIR